MREAVIDVISVHIGWTHQCKDVNQVFVSYSFCHFSTLARFRCGGTLVALTDNSTNYGYH